MPPDNYIIPFLKLFVNSKIKKLKKTKNFVQFDEKYNQATSKKYIDEQIAQMTLSEKVAGLFFVTPEAITGVNTAVQAGEGTKTALEKYPVAKLRRCLHEQQP